jgi:hypothetical protein
MHPLTLLALKAGALVGPSFRGISKGEDSSYQRKQTNSLSVTMILKTGQAKKAMGKYLTLNPLKVR